MNSVSTLNVPKPARTIKITHDKLDKLDTEALTEELPTSNADWFRMRNRGFYHVPEDLWSKALVGLAAALER